MSATLLLRLFALALLLCSATLPAASDAIGPLSGPAAQPGRHVLLLAYDLQNGGIAKTARGFLSAAHYLGWQVAVIDGQGDAALVRKTLRSSAAAASIAGVAFFGGDSKAFHAELTALDKAGKVLVGWHAGEMPGPNGELFTNVTTDPVAVAQAAVDYALQTSSGPIGAVIFTDSTFAIAMRKAHVMQTALQHCKRCKVLAVEDVKIATVAHTLPALIVQLNARYGFAWTHNFAINDIYFDNISFPLYRLGRQDLVNIAAGDGSSLAIRRIRLGLSQQKASIAEPCDQQGWQAADEMNRAFAHQPPSGYLSRPILITEASLADAGEGGDVEPNTAYRKRYLAIWLQRAP
jgi:ribose transport system substrate-binding protein